MPPHGATARRPPICCRSFTTNCANSRRHDWPTNRRGKRLQPTALVHEAYLRLVGPDIEWDGRGHFFAAAAEAMRRILVDGARRKKAEKHGGGLQRFDAAELPIAAPEPIEDLVALDDALNRLAEHDATKAELVKLRYFAGLTIEQAAEVLDISPATAKRYWTYSRAWLFRAMEGTSDENSLKKD